MSCSRASVSRWGAIDSSRRLLNRCATRCLVPGWKRYSRRLHRRRLRKLRSLQVLRQLRLQRAREEAPSVLSEQCCSECRRRRRLHRPAEDRAIVGRRLSLRCLLGSGNPYSETRLAERNRGSLSICAPSACANETYLRERVQSVHNRTNTT